MTRPATTSAPRPGCSCSSILALLALLLVGAFIVSCTASATGLAGERPPVPPRTYYEDVNSVVITPIQPKLVKSTEGPVFFDGARIAVIQFRSPEDTQGGVLVSDTLATLLREQGFQVFERDRVDRILEEQQLASDGLVNLSDLEVAQALGQLESVDYMVFGAVTLYRIEPQAVYLPIRIVEEDKARYVERYEEFRRWYLEDWFPFRLSYFQSEEEKLKRLRSVDNVWSLEDLENEYRKLSRREFRIIASVGVSAKVVDVRTGAIVWSGQAETNDFTLVNGSRRILQEFLASIQS